MALLFYVGPAVRGLEPKVSDCVADPWLEFKVRDFTYG